MFIKKFADFLNMTLLSIYEIPPNSLEYNLILTFTIFIVVIKTSIVVYLGNLIRKKRKDKGAVALDTFYGVFLLILFLLIARIFFMVFDYQLTAFDRNLYPTYANIWKIGMMFSGFAPIYLTFVLDKKILNFKFKGIPAYILIATVIFGLIYPVNTLEDFYFISGIGVVGAIGVLIIPAIFFYIIKISTGEMRKTAVLIIVGLMLWAVGGVLVVDTVVQISIDMNPTIDPNQIQVYIYLISTISKTTGLIIFAIGAGKMKL